MTVQTVNSVASLFFRSVTVSGANAGAETFGKVMDRKVQSGTEAKTETTGTQSRKADYASEAEVENRPEAVTKAAPEAKTSQASSEAEAADTIEAVEETEVPEELTVPEDMLAKVIELLNQITQAIQDIFGVSEEQLQQSAGQLGTQPADLFQADSLQQLVLQFSDATAEQLLTDGELYGKLEQLQAQVEQLLAENGFTAEQLGTESFGIQLNQAILNGTGEAGIQTIEVKELVINMSEQSVVLKNETKAVQTETAELTNIEAEPEIPDLKKALMQESNTEADAQAGNNANTFLQNLAAAKAATVPEQAAAMRTFQDVYDIAGQLIEQVKVSITADSTSMELQLYPEHLGKVDLQITSKNGAMTAQLTTQNEVSKEAIESQIQVLRETLENQGIKVDAIEVTVSEFGFRQGEENTAGQQEQQGNKGRSHFAAADEADIAEELFRETVEVLKEMNGNSVDYVA